MTNHTQPPASPIVSPRPVPEWAKARLCAHINVYSKALAALLLADPVQVRKLWRELTPDMAGRANTSFLNKIQAVASALADRSADEVDAFLEGLERQG